MSEKTPASDEEPFLLTILPFAGLFLLLVLALVWRLFPEQTSPEASAVNAAIQQVVDRWQGAQERTIPIEPGRDFSRGPEDAPITIVEFSDFECPYCREAAFGVHKILEQYEGKVRVVFKNFPLDQACNETLPKPLHTYACDAALIATCAGVQSEDLFWRAHDAMFNGSKLTGDRLKALPAELGLDREALDACLASDDARERVREDITLARELGISGTPVFFANGRRLTDYRIPALDAVIEHILADSPTAAP